MKNQIKLIEDLSLNAWPSHQIEIYDSWLLRFSYFYTHRTNSVEQIGPSTIPIKEKIAYCERIYEKWQTPSIFKITPLIDSSFDQLLAERGYQVAHITQSMTLDLEYAPLLSPCVEVMLEKEIPDWWIDALFSLKGTTNPIHRQIVPSMYHAIPKRTIAASIWQNGRIVATGLGILDREYLGIYAIHVDALYRKRKFGFSLCQAILAEGRRQGAQNAYLQVVHGNLAAKNLYTSLGFKDFYTYWFRQKEPCC